jgi:hypothetical protein
MTFEQKAEAYATREAAYWLALIPNIITDHFPLARFTAILKIAYMEGSTQGSRDALSLLRTPPAVPHE